MFATILPSNLQITPSRTHPAKIIKFTSVPGSKVMQPIILSDTHAWTIHVKQAPGVNQEKCAVFRVNSFGGDVNKCYRATVGHYLTARAKRSPEERGELCPICFAFHDFVGEECISPFVDCNAMLCRSTHPLCSMCGGIHHAGYACVSE